MLAIRPRTKCKKSGKGQIYNLTPSVGQHGALLGRADEDAIPRSVGHLAPTAADSHPDRIQEYKRRFFRRKKGLSARRKSGLKGEGALLP
jgi:hypothetical protein